MLNYGWSKINWINTRKHFVSVVSSCSIFLFALRFFGFCTQTITSRCKQQHRAIRFHVIRKCRNIVSILFAIIWYQTSFYWCNSIACASFEFFANSLFLPRLNTLTKSVRLETKAKNKNHLFFLYSFSFFKNDKSNHKRKIKANDCSKYMHFKSMLLCTSVCFVLIKDEEFSNAKNELYFPYFYCMNWAKEKGRDYYTKRRRSIQTQKHKLSHTFALFLCR